MDTAGRPAFPAGRWDLPKSCRIRQFGQDGSSPLWGTLVQSHIDLSIPSALETQARNMDLSPCPPSEPSELPVAHPAGQKCGLEVRGAVPWLRTLLSSHGAYHSMHKLQNFAVLFTPRSVAERCTRALLPILHALACIKFRISRSRPPTSCCKTLRRDTHICSAMHTKVCINFNSPTSTRQPHFDLPGAFTSSGQRPVILSCHQSKRTCTACTSPVIPVRS